MISIIVPVYNVEAYLRKCVESICAQTERELEILLVDDGSTDSSGAICDELAKRDPRIRVYHKPNGGLMSAWKYGVSRTSGEWIGFVDSDDSIDPDMYARLLSQALRYDADLTLCGVIREYDDHSENESVYPDREFYDRAAIEGELFPRMLNMGGMLNRYVSPNRVTKLFRRSLLEQNLPFCDERISLGEDLVTTFACMCDAQSVAVCRDFFPYHYLIRGSSIMGRFNPDFYRQSVLLSEKLRSIAAHKNVYDFSRQLTDDFLSLAYYGIEQNAAKAAVTRREMTAYIKMTLEDPFFRSELPKSTLSAHSSKCRIYRLLGALHGYGLLCSFVRRVVLPRRN